MTSKQKALLARYAALDWSLADAFAKAGHMAPAREYAAQARLYQHRVNDAPLDHGTRGDVVQEIVQKATTGHY